MSVKWILREVLAQRGFTTASEISRIIQERTRYSISTQAVCDLLNDEPKMLRIETAQAFCDAFGLRVSEFFDMEPGPLRKLEVCQSASRRTYTYHRSGGGLLIPLFCCRGALRFQAMNR